MNVIPFKTRMKPSNGEITLCNMSFVVRIVLPVCHQMSLYKILQKETLHDISLITHESLPYFYILYVLNL